MAWPNMHPRIRGSSVSDGVKFHFLLILENVGCLSIEDVGAAGDYIAVLGISFKTFLASQILCENIFHKS